MPSLQTLMELISNLQRTIVLLTAKLEAYEKRDKENQVAGQDIDDPNRGASSTLIGLPGQPGLGTIPFSVNFGGVTNPFQLGTTLNQDQSYASALASSSQSGLSVGAGILKRPHQLSVPQPGVPAPQPGVGSGPPGRNGVNGVTGTTGRVSSRYDPFKDRNNVAFSSNQIRSLIPVQNQAPNPARDQMKKKVLGMLVGQLPWDHDQKGITMESRIIFQQQLHPL